MEANWPELSLGEISENPQYGYTGNAISEKVGPRYMRITDITDTGEILSENKVFVNMEEKELKNFKLEKGDILIARTGTVGRATIFNTDEDAVFASYLVRFKINPQRAIPKYVFYYLKSDAFANYVQKEKIGVAQIYLNGKKMAKFKLKLPPLHVQEKIVKKLDKFFESLNKIKERQNAIELKRSVLTGSAVDDIFEKLSKNKADKLSNLSLRVTQGPNPKYMGESDKGYFVLKTKDFYNDVVLYENCTGLSKKLFEEFKNFELFDDDIIIGLVGVGSIGKINIFKQQSGKKYIFTRATGLIRTSKKLNPHYLLAFFNSKKGKKFIEQGISGTTGQLVIKTSYLKNLVIPCPEQKTQEKIANEATKIYMLNKNIDEELQQIQTKLNLLPKAVLTKAFSGAL